MARRAAWFELESTCGLEHVQIWRRTFCVTGIDHRPAGVRFFPRRPTDRPQIRRSNTVMKKCGRSGTVISDTKVRIKLFGSTEICITCCYLPHDKRSYRFVGISSLIVVFKTKSWCLKKLVIFNSHDNNSRTIGRIFLGDATGGSCGFAWNASLFCLLLIRRMGG